MVIPDHAPVSVTEIPAWKLHRDVGNERSDRRCWSTAHGIIQDVIEGGFMDYQVDDILSIGFKFGGL